jgi:hypothetical protein
MGRDLVRKLVEEMGEMMVWLLVLLMDEQKEGVWERRLVNDSQLEGL